MSINLRLQVIVVLLLTFVLIGMTGPEIHAGNPSGPITYGFTGGPGSYLKRFHPTSTSITTYTLTAAQYFSVTGRSAMANDAGEQAGFCETAANNAGLAADRQRWCIVLLEGSSGLTIPGPDVFALGATGNAGNGGIMDPTACAVGQGGCHMSLNSSFKGVVVKIYNTAPTVLNAWMVPNGEVGSIPSYFESPSLPPGYFSTTPANDCVGLAAIFGGSNDYCGLYVAGSLNLTATTVATTTTPGARALSGTVNSVGSSGTGAGFTVLFQVANDASGTGAVNVGDGTPTATLGANNSRLVTSNDLHTFSSAGTQYYRMCADLPPLWYGVISEGNESDNCSPWTAITIGATVGGTCSVSPTSATAGQLVTWTASATGGNGTYTYAWTLPTGTPTSGTGNPRTATYATNGAKSASVVITSNGVASAPITCSNQVTVTATECSDGINNNDGDSYTDYPNDPGCSSQSDTTEAPNPPAGPTGTPSAYIEANPTRVNQGGTAALSWSAQNVTSCTITSNNGTFPATSAVVTPAFQVATTTPAATGAITTQSVYTITCVPAVTATAVVNVTPKLDEF